jgi:cell wall-associated NlpC family hydrolase
MNYNTEILCKFLQIPFKDKGRDFNGCDCLGIVSLFYKEVFNIEITEFTPSCYDINTILKGFEKHITEWEKITEPVFGCLVAMNNYRKIPNAVNHIGIYLGDDEVLHIKPKMYAIREKITNPNFLKIMGYYVFNTT